MFKNIPTFVVNLKRSTERRKYIENHLKDKNIQYELIEAVDRENLTEEQIRKVADKEWVIKLSSQLPQVLKGIIGCALSHKKIFKRIVSESLPYALILEDDALIEDGIDKNFLDSLPMNWDVLLLGYHLDNTEPVPPIPCSFWGRYKKDNFVIAKPVRKVAGTHGYIVSQQGAKRLLQLTQPLKKPIDGYTGDRKLVNLFIFKKPIIRVNYTYGNHTTLVSTSISEKNKNPQPKIDRSTSSPNKSS